MIVPLLGKAVHLMTGARGTLLLVDDDDLTRDLLIRFLERNGFAATGVGTGVEALALIEKGGHDLILLDILMEGMGGLEILRDVRRRHSPTDLPVIMATSRDQPRDVVEALQLGANDYVTKPFDFPVVLARVQTQLSLKRSVDQIRQLELGLLLRNAELEEANRRMKRDLAAAAKVQAALLPGATPMTPAARFAWEFKPCTELAGDLLNVIPIDDRRVAMYVLDVVGHGVAAALVAVMANRVLTQLHLAADRLASPSEVATRLNAEFSWDPQTCQFLTLLYGVLDLDAGGFRFVTAGHPGPVYLPHDAQPRNLRLPSSPIGLGDEPYAEHFLKLRSGDRLYLYSDGVPEACGRNSKCFGVNRLLTHLDQSRTATLPDSLDGLLRAVHHWCDGLPPEDDISLLGVELA
jgi:phosphoserine phosphatase RsbU/P